MRWRLSRIRYVNRIPRHKQSVCVFRFLKRSCKEFHLEQCNILLWSPDAQDVTSLRLLFIHKLQTWFDAFSEMKDEISKCRSLHGRSASFSPENKRPVAVGAHKAATYCPLQNDNIMLFSALTDARSLSGKLAIISIYLPSWAILQNTLPGQLRQTVFVTLQANLQIHYCNSNGPLLMFFFVCLFLYFYFLSVFKAGLCRTIGL